MSQEPNRWVFDFRDKAGGLGTLTLALPATVSIFEVDPRRGERPGGQGPTLYKEWKLTSAAAGTGIFAPGVGSGQRITLILQGHGNSCTSSSDFTHWSIVISGPKAQYTVVRRPAAVAPAAILDLADACSPARATDYAIPLFIYRRSLT